jgi:hypothetical protein
MPDENLNVELTLIAVPLPPEMEEAYWQALEILAELIREAQSLDGGGLRSEKIVGMDGMPFLV